MNFTFYVCVCPHHAISLLFEAASCVLSEKHSLLAAQSAPLLCTSLPSISFLLRKVYDRMWFLVFMSSVCRSYFDIFTSHFLLGGWGGFIPIFYDLWRSVWKAFLYTSTPACVCPVSGIRSTFISGVFNCLRSLLKTGCCAFSLDLLSDSYIFRWCFPD